MGTLHKNWTLKGNEVFEEVLDQVDTFFRENLRNYASRYPEDTPERRLSGWEPTVWYENLYLLKAISDIEEQINAGGDATIEIRQSQTISGNTETESFPRSMFARILEDEI